MATDPTIPYQYLPSGFASAPQTQINFDTFLKYVKERNNGTVAWDSFSVSGSSTLTSPVTINGSGATTELRLNNTATDGDPLLTWQLSGTNQFTMGVNDGSSDVLQIGTTAIDTGLMWQATSSGEITQPLQPCFLVTDGTGATNVTGDGTTYTQLWPTEVYDQGADFSSNTFTAPVTGRYDLAFGVEISDLLAAHTVRQIDLVTSNRTYRFVVSHSLAEPVACFAYSVLADMDAGDTAILQVRVQGSTKTISIPGTANANFFSGSLVN